MSVKAFAKPGTAAKVTPAKSGNAKSIQRKVLPGLFVPSAIQRKENTSSWLNSQPLRSAGNRSFIQPKVKVHAANDHYEKEADHIADKVVSNEKIVSPAKVSRVNRAAQRKCTNCEKEDTGVQAMHVQRKCSSCEQKEAVQAKENKNTDTPSFHNSDSGPPVSSKHSSNHTLESVLANQSTRGSPLPDSTRRFMESRMGADLSNVRVHTGQSSHEASTSIGARAFTHGANIHFANGEFNPETKAGKHLLAHELAHTLQQGAAPEKTPAKSAGPVKGLRKVVPKPKHEKKIARLSSPHHNAAQSQKEEGQNFAKKFRNKKAPKLPASLLKKEKGKKLNKDPVVLPKKEKKKQGEIPKPVAKPKHIQNAKGQHTQIAQLFSKGIQFKPHEDKKLAEDPAHKAQSLQSKKISENVLLKASLAATNIVNSIAGVRPRLNLAATKAINKVKANEAAQKENIDTEIKNQKAAVKKAMQSAAGSINGYHKKVTGDLKKAATKGRADILQAKTQNTSDISAAAKAQTPIIKGVYDKAKPDFEASGRTVGNKCSADQNERSWSQFISKMKHEDDSFLDGPYTDDMKQARGDAAIKVGDGFKEGITKAGVDQGAEIHKGMPNDLKKIEEGETEMQKQVVDAYDKALKAIDAAEKAGISQADSTKKSMLASVGTQHKAAQAKLDLTKKVQTQLTEILSLKQCQQIELQYEQAAESMEEGGAQGLMHLHNGFKEYKQVCESMNSPPPAMLQQKLMPIEASLAKNAPAMAATMHKGMLQTEAGFSKTAGETIATTNTTVAQSLAEATADNTKAIDGLKKLQSSAITALQGIFNKNNATITSTASQCVIDIKAIKTGFDTTLTNIITDLEGGLKKGSEELKTGLTDTVTKGSGETKAMLTTSMDEEQKAADEVSPRWKSALKILLVVVVTLVIALVVGPAVIGFIGAAAGGGAFGAAVGAVVGGAILGAASSAVITIGNNLIDGKTWYTGVGHAMLEGAITGAIGGAFGAAGSGIAGKLIGTAAKGIGPALGRFAIQQTIDFAGNVTTEYVSSKLQGKPFSWTNVAQGQAIGVGMHIGMGGLGALKDVKGFKTINKITEGAGHFGESFGNKVRGKVPVVEPHVAPVKTTVEEPLNKGPSAPKEEPHATSKPAEETKTGPKEEPTKTAPSEEPTKVAPKEEPVTTAPKEEPHGGSKTKEEPAGGTKSKEEPVGTIPKEEGTQKGKSDEPSPENPKVDDSGDKIVSEEKSKDGSREVEVTDDGKCKVCSSPCAEIKKKYEKEIKRNPEIEQKLDEIKNSGDSTAVKSKKYKEIEQQLANARKADAKLVAGTEAHKKQRWLDHQLENPGKFPELKADYDPKWSKQYDTVIENGRVGSQFEKDALGAKGYKKNNEILLEPGGENGFIPDSIKGNPKEIKWGDNLDFVEVKGWKEMSNLSDNNLDKMLNYVEAHPKSSIEIVFTSDHPLTGKATSLSGPFQKRIDGMIQAGLNVKITYYP